MLWGSWAFKFEALYFILSLLAFLLLELYPGTHSFSVFGAVGSNVVIAFILLLCLEILFCFSRLQNIITYLHVVLVLCVLDFIHNQRRYSSSRSTLCWELLQINKHLRGLKFLNLSHISQGYSSLKLRLGAFLGTNSRVPWSGHSTTTLLLFDVFIRLVQ